MASINQLVFPPQQQRSNKNSIKSAFFFRFTDPNFMYQEKYFRKKLLLQLAVLCTAGLGDMSRPDTHTIRRKPDRSRAAPGRRRFSVAKEVFWWPEGKQPAPGGPSDDHGESIEAVQYVTPRRPRTDPRPAANCSRLCSQLVQQPVANAIRSLRNKSSVWQTAFCLT